MLQAYLLLFYHLNIQQLAHHIVYRGASFLLAISTRMLNVCPPTLNNAEIKLTFT